MAGSGSVTIHHSPFLRAVASISAQHRVRPPKLDILAGFVARRPSPRADGAGKALRRKIPRSEHTICSAERDALQNAERSSLAWLPAFDDAPPNNSLPTCRPQQRCGTQSNAV